MLKRLFHIFIVMYASCILTQELPHKDRNDNLLAVLIMVRNDVDVIIPTLQPFIDTGITKFLVYDVGSTDNTPNKVRECFDAYGFEWAYVIEESFLDSATSYNRMLDLAEQIFSDTTFVLMLQAEWYMHNIAELLNFCEKNKYHSASDSTNNCYRVRYMDDHYVTRLIRQGRNVRYEGPVFEYIVEQSGIVPDSIYFEEQNPEVLRIHQYFHDFGQWLYT